MRMPLIVGGTSEIPEHQYFVRRNVLFCPPVFLGEIALFALFFSVSEMYLITWDNG